MGVTRASAVLRRTLVPLPPLAAGMPAQAQGLPGDPQGSRMSVADDELEHVVVVPGGLLAPAA
jgi:hypothetical protein